MNSAELPSIFLPPVNRSMQDLDRSFFRKTIDLAAAGFPDIKQAQNIRTALFKSRELLSIFGIKALRDDPSQPGAKCFLLQPHIKASDPATWSQDLHRLVSDGHIRVFDYNLLLRYEDWTLTNILEATLPEMPDDEKETPAGFAQVGHVAHLNLRRQYLPFKFLIGQVLLDKNPTVTTVINKTLDVGTESKFRTFPYEVLAGPDDLNVEVSESGCHFRFDFAKVYWNPRLSHEHERLVEKFQPGQAVCDVMAGVGPFAIPAGRRKIFVHANDLNPHCFDALQWAITKNKVGQFVSAYCDDGRQFIRESTDMLLRHRREVQVQPNIKISRNMGPKEHKQALTKIKEGTQTISEPPSFNHFVMNLPASAIEFLDAFQGLYKGREAEFVPTTERKLPLIHVHLFQTKKDVEEEEHQEIHTRISEILGAGILTGDPDFDLHYVRLVSPKKKMYCATFRLPPKVAFAKDPLK